MGTNMGIGMNRNFYKPSFAQLVKDAGGVLYLDARKADGSLSLTGNDSPFVDLSPFSNDGILNNFAGSGTSGWQDSPPVLRFDGVDDFCGFTDTASLDIVNAPLGLGCTIKMDSGISKYIMSKNLDLSTNIQYAMFLSNTSSLNFFLDGNTRVSAIGLDLTLYVNIVFFWDGAKVFIFINGIEINNAIYVNPSLTSQPNIQLGARSISIDGITKNFFYDGDIATTTIYTGTDIKKILNAETKISAQYLALNP